MSFPARPTGTATSAPVEPSLPDAASYVPALHATDTLPPRWSIWTLVSATWGIVTAVGVGAAMFSGSAAAGVLCVAAGPALVCGVVGLVNISESNGRLKGRRFAVIGVVTGFVGLFMLTHMMSSQFFSRLPPHLFPSDD
ncbi:MAG: DUF4190 domain-containing protein [Nitrososphaerota archaeon]